MSYLQLAHSERHPVTGVPQARVIHNFGRAEAVDRDALARLVASISRFLDPEQAIAAAHTGEIEILDSRRLGGVWLLDRLWARLGVGAALRGVAADRRLDADAAERVLFALVAQRALEPGSKLAATRWVAERVAIAGCGGFCDDAAYRAMDFLLDALGNSAITAIMVAAGIKWRRSNHTNIGRAWIHIIRRRVGESTLAPVRHAPLNAFAVREQHSQPIR